MVTNTRGFTLLEILVAMAIFTLIGLAGNAVLTSVLDSNKLSKQRTEHLNNLRRAMLTLERDILQATPRSVRIEGQNTSIVMSGARDLLESEGDGLAFVHGGWHNPQQMLPRSTLQAVGYRLQEGRLEKLYGNYVDNIIGYEPKVRVLLEEVEDFQVEYLLADQDDPKNNKWSESYKGTTLPKALAIEITDTHFGKIRREFLLTSGAPANE